MRRYFTFAPTTNRTRFLRRGDLIASPVVTSSVIMMVMKHGAARPVDFRKTIHSEVTRIRHRICLSQRRVLIGVQDMDGRRLPNPCLSIRVLVWNEWAFQFREQR